MTQVTELGPEAFACALYDAHVDRVRRVLSRMVGPHADVDDLTQDVFELALRRRAAVEAQGDGTGAWLCGVAVKLAQARRRSEAIRRFLGLEALDTIAGDDDSTRAVSASHARRLLYAALDRLSEKKRTVFVLYEIDEMQGDEIAALLGCPIKTVWSRLAHAREEVADAVRSLSREGGNP